MMTRICDGNPWIILKMIVLYYIARCQKSLRHLAWVWPSFPFELYFLTLRTFGLFCQETSR